MTKKRKNKKKHIQRKQTFPQKASSLFFKQILLALLSIGILFIYFSTPYYKLWFEQRILRYYREVPHQIEIIDDINRRLTERHGYNYLIPKMIQERTSDSSVILFPTQTYVKKNFSDDYFRWQNARWSYYFTGHRSYMIYKTTTEQDFSKVTHAIVCKNQQIQLVKIDSPIMLKVVLETYKNDG